MTDTNEVELIPYIFSNKPDSPHLGALLAMFYEGANRNTIGVMEAFDLIESEEVLLLVGVAADEEGKPVCFPIAKMLKAEDVPNFLSPDGKGGFYDPNDPTEAAEARENLKPIKEAVEQDNDE